MVSAPVGNDDTLGEWTPILPGASVSASGGITVDLLLTGTGAAMSYLQYFDDVEDHPDERGGRARRIYGGQGSAPTLTLRW